MSLPKPYYEDAESGIVIYHGDCSEILPRLAFDSLITDPPYIIGASSVGNAASKSGTWADMMNASRWYADWLAQAKARMSQHGYFAVCGNWRGLPTYMRACNLAGISCPSCLVWDKQWIGPAYKNALRPTYELVLIGSMPEAEIPNRSTSDVFTYKWLAGQCKTTEHAAEKPVGLMEHLVTTLVAEGQIVCDPFMGSGTTLVACKNKGVKAVGIEIEERYAEIAAKRLAQGVLFGPSNGDAA